MAKRSEQERREAFLKDIVRLAWIGPVSVRDWAKLVHLPPHERDGWPVVEDRSAIDDGADPAAARHKITSETAARGVDEILREGSGFDSEFVERVRACSAAYSTDNGSRFGLDGEACDNIIQIGLFGGVRYTNRR